MEEKNAPDSAEIQTSKDMLKALRQEFAVFGDFKPLAIGIDKQLMALRPDFSKKLLRPAMGLHTRSIPYLKSLQSAEVRFNLDGSPADPVSPAQRELASQTLREHFKARADKHKAEKAQQAAAAAAVAAEQERLRKLIELAEKFGRK